MGELHLPNQQEVQEVVRGEKREKFEVGDRDQFRALSDEEYKLSLTHAEKLAQIARIRDRGNHVRVLSAVGKHVVRNLAEMDVMGALTPEQRKALLQLNGFYARVFGNEEWAQRKSGFMAEYAVMRSMHDVLKGLGDEYGVYYPNVEDDTRRSVDALLRWEGSDGKDWETIPIQIKVVSSRGRTAPQLIYKLGNMVDVETMIRDLLRRGYGGDEFKTMQRSGENELKKIEISGENLVGSLGDFRNAPRSLMVVVSSPESTNLPYYNGQTGSPTEPLLTAMRSQLPQVW